MLISYYFGETTVTDKKFSKEQFGVVISNFCTPTVIRTRYYKLILKQGIGLEPKSGDFFIQRTNLNP